MNLNAAPPPPPKKKKKNYKNKNKKKKNRAQISTHAAPRMSKKSIPGRLTLKKKKINKV